MVNFGKPILLFPVTDSHSSKHIHAQLLEALRRLFLEIGQRCYDPPMLNEILIVIYSAVSGVSLNGK